ncbi:phasin family protein [Parachitinimonas caeni]|uniref:Phasin family protein n=1 Tax=Parachitinimonas caeni TaxID=3031301 RepID=A0ABT7DWW3_9NEIS|nr:phasin family protein [Parachitinimonas caeni]MDK2124552.1 phasin family protein [Parachitinimonas caeni]
MVSMNTHPLSDLASENLETVLRFSKITLDSAERLAKLQFEVAKQSIEESTKIAGALASVKDVQDAMALRTKLSESAVETTLGFSRNVYELASQTQSEISKLFEERITEFNKSIVSGMDKVVKSAPAGADVAVAAMKSTVAATAAAVDSMTKAAKQVADFADASVKAATTATADAVKSAAGTKR